jgi:hypothetical protein
MLFLPGVQIHGGLIFLAFFFFAETPDWQSVPFVFDCISGVSVTPLVLFIVIYFEVAGLFLLLILDHNSSIILSSILKLEENK